MKRVVLVGGGHSHLEVVRRFGALPAANTEIVLVDCAQFATYSGMLPGLIAGHYEFADCQVDLPQLAHRAGVRFVRAAACGVDTARRQVGLGDGRLLDYDLLSLDVGSTPPTAGVAGAAEHALAVKPFPAFAQRWERIADSSRAGTVRSVVIVGGGAAGLELVLAMHYRLAQSTSSRATAFALVTASPGVLPDRNRATRAAGERLLAERGIAVHLNAGVVRVEADAVIVANAAPIPSDATIWATGAAPPAWFKDTRLALDARGFVSVDACLSSITQCEVFAAGDCATIAGHDYPKSGVYAVRQGPVLAANLRRALAGAALRPYQPQRLALALLSAGDRYAIASYGRLKLEGAWVWRWKDHIDRKFVRRYRA